MKKFLLSLAVVATAACAANAMDIPEHLYIVGNIVDHSWTPEDSPEMTLTAPGVFEADVDFAGAGDGNSFFSFIPALGSWDEVNAGIRYGANTEDPFGLDEPQALTQYPTEDMGANATPAFKLTYEGLFHVTVDMNEETMTVTEAAGINGISADNNATAVYYNLNGVRVNNPENGLFIVKKGDKVSKVIL